MPTLQAPKPKKIPAGSPQSPPTGALSDALGKILAPGTSPQSVSPPPVGKQFGPPVPPGYADSRAGLSPGLPNPATMGTPYGGLPAQAPAQAPSMTPPAPVNGGIGRSAGANLQNLLSGVTPSRAGMATGASQQFQAPPAPTGQAPAGSGMQLPSMDANKNLNPAFPQPPRPDFPQFFQEQQPPGPAPQMQYPYAESPGPGKGPLNALQPGKGPLFNPADQLGVSPQYQGPPAVAPQNQGLADAVAAMHRRNFPNEGQRATVPLPVPPMANELFKGGHPITKPTGGSMARDAMAQGPGGLMTNEQAAKVYRDSPADSKYMASRTVGGAYGDPGATPLPFEKKAPPKAQPLGGFAGNDKEFNMRMENENRNGALFGRTLPVRGPDGRVAFADGPMKDFGMKNSGQFETDANGRTTKKGGYSSTELQAQADAKATFDNRRGGLAARRADYESRTASKAADRKSNVQSQAFTRSEARRERMGRLNPAESLARKDPKAAAQRAIGEAQVGANAARDKATDATNRERIASGERLAGARDKVALQVSKDRIAAAAAANGQPLPADPSASPASPAPSPYNDNDYRALGKPDAVAHMIEQGMTPSQINDSMNRIHGTANINYYQNPNGRAGFAGGASAEVPLPPQKGPDGKVVPAKKPKNPAQIASERYGAGSGYAF